MNLPLDDDVALQEDSSSLSSPLNDVYIPLAHFEHTHPNTVLEGLNRLRLNSALCDVILCCGGQEFPCHRVVLASFSPYFEAMFTSDMVESKQERVTINAVEPQIFEMVVNYAYTTLLFISIANVQALVVASNLFDVMAIRDACCDFMQGHMDISNCLGIYFFAEAHCCKKLEQHSRDYILEHFSDIYQQEEFLSLSVEQLTEILGSDHLSVPKEDMVFEAGMLWLDKCPTRRQNFEQVLKQIRLPLISPSYLHTVIESLDVVKEYQGCQRFISEAKDQPNRNTAAQPRRTTVIVVLGGGHRDRIQSFDPLTKQWKTLGRMPCKVEMPAVAKSGCTLYLTGGEFADHTPNKGIWRYDVSGNMWKRMGNMNEQHYVLSMVMLDGYLYAIAMRTIQRYDRTTYTWQLMDSSDLAAHYDDNFFNFAVVSLEGHLYFIGVNPSCSIHKVAKYNPETSVCIELPPMQNPRHYPAVCTLNGKIFVMGGEHHIPRNSMINDIVLENATDCYNPKTNQWTTCAPMQLSRTEAAAVEVDGKLYVLGGRDETNGDVQIMCYCDETDTWETVGQMPILHDGFRCLSFRLRKDCAAIVDDVYDDVDSDDDFED